MFAAQLAKELMDNNVSTDSYIAVRFHPEDKNKYKLDFHPDDKHQEDWLRQFQFEFAAILFAYKKEGLKLDQITSVLHKDTGFGYDLRVSSYKHMKDTVYLISFQTIQEDDEEPSDPVAVVEAIK